jgi:hypothetical protein
MPITHHTPDGGRTELQYASGGGRYITTYDADGNVKSVVLLDAQGKEIEHQIHNADGTITSSSGYGPDTVTDAKGNRLGWADPKTGLLATPEQQATDQAQADAANADDTSWGGTLKTAAKSVWDASEGLDPLDHPGFNGGVLSNKVLGGPNADKPLFDNSGVGKILQTVAGAYGLGGITGGSGTGAGGTGGAGGTNGSGIDTSPITAAAAASKAMQDKFLADYNAAHPGQPPVMTAAQLPPAVLATMPEAIRPGVADAVGNITAGHADATLLDPTFQAQQRDKQLGLESTIQDAIDGRAPSVAQLQLDAARQANEANQLGIASKASGGGNVALALRTAANNTGRLNQGASADAALLRAKEIADARAQLGGVLDQTRGSDISLADKNAGLATHVSETNAGLTTNTAMKDAELEAARRATNATNETTAAGKSADLATQIAAANAKAANDMAQKQGELTNTAGANNLTAAGNQLTLDEQTRQNLAKNALDAGGQVITGTVGAADAQAKAVAAAQAAKAAEDAKQAAGLGALGTTIASLWKNSGSGSGTTTGTNGSPILS